MAVERTKVMELNDLYVYDNGILRYKIDRSYRYRAGMPVGSPDKEGYMRTTIDKKGYKVHRIIWEMHNGPIPDGLMIDHINGVVDDNRIENLRLATNSQNQGNRDTKGYWRQQNSWVVRVRGNFYGYYQDEELAELIANEAKLKEYGEYSRSKH